MGCGGSKEDVATGNTTAANGAGRGTKLFRRKSTVSSSHRSSESSSSSSDGSSVAIKDVVKEPSACEPKAEDGVEVASDDKPVEEKKEEAVVKKDAVAAAEVAASATVENEAAAVPPTAQPPVKEEDDLPKSTMADEAPVVDEAKADEAKEAVVAEEANKEEETSPATRNGGGKSAGQSTEGMESNPVDEHNVEVAAPVLPESSSQEKTVVAPDIAPSNSTTI